MSQANQTGKRILVVEDDEIIRIGLAAILEKNGYAVTLAANGDVALGRLQTEPRPDLILLDMMMEAPACDGWRFLVRRKDDAAQAAIPVVITTALPVCSREW